MNVKQSGNAFERQVANILRDHYGYQTRRGVQFRSGQEEADVVGLPRIHIECKFYGDINASRLEAWMAQSEHDAQPDEYPAVFWKKKKVPGINVMMRTRDFIAMTTGAEVHSGGKVTMLLEDFMRVYEETR